MNKRVNKMTRAYKVTLEVEVYGDNLENAKDNAIEYFNQVSEVADSEIVEAWNTIN